MGGGDLATMIDVMTGLDVAEEKEFHPMYEETKGRLPDAPKWDEATERGHSELIRVGAAIDVDGCTVTRLPIQLFSNSSTISTKQLTWAIVLGHLDFNATAASPRRLSYCCRSPTISKGNWTPCMHHRKFLQQL